MLLFSIRVCPIHRTRRSTDCQNTHHGHFDGLAFDEWFVFPSTGDQRQSERDISLCCTCVCVRVLAYSMIHIACYGLSLNLLPDSLTDRNPCDLKVLLSLSLSSLPTFTSQGVQVSSLITMLSIVQRNV